MSNSSLLRQFVFVFGLTFLSILVLLEVDLAGHMAYKAEKGRLRAIKEALPSADELAAEAQPAREVARLVTPAVVFIETEVQPIALSNGKTLDELLDDWQPPDGDDAATADAGSKADDDASTDEGESEARNWSDVHPWSMTGLGSGFIIDANRGLIVTNNHVIARSKKIEVQLADGRRFTAKVVGSDPETDLAVISIDADRLHDLEFGDSDLVEVGDDVFALGNPFGLAGTVSRGIISAKGRFNVNIHGIVYRGFLQTDAVINPGNSGGPLVNMRGEVIGVNTAIATHTGRYDGVGFAIPASRVTALLPDLINGRTVVRGFLGVVSRSVDDFPEQVAALGWTEDYGVLLTEVRPGTGAAAAGLQVDDILLELDGTRVLNADQFLELIAPIAPGTEITLLVWRNKQTMKVRATLGDRSDISF